MAGKIQRMIDRIISARAQGNEAQERVVRTKLMLKGINPAHYSDQSDDDPTVIRKLEKMLRDLNH